MNRNNIYLWVDFGGTLLHELGHAIVAWLLAAQIDRVLIGTQTYQPGPVFALLKPSDNGFNGNGLCVYTGLNCRWARAVVAAAGFLFVFGFLTFVGTVIVLLSGFFFWLSGIPVALIAFIEWVVFFIYEPLIFFFAARGCSDDYQDIRYEYNWRSVVATLGNS